MGKSYNRSRIFQDLGKLRRLFIEEDRGVLLEGDLDELRGGLCMRILPLFVETEVFLGKLKLGRLVLLLEGDRPVLLEGDIDELRGGLCMRILPLLAETEVFRVQEATTDPLRGFAFGRGREYAYGK